MASNAHQHHQKLRGSTSVGYRSNGGIDFISLETVLELLILYQIMMHIMVGDSHNNQMAWGAHRQYIIN